MNISLVVPTRNEEQIAERNLEEIHAYLKSRFREFEILVCDYSEDRTGDIVNGMEKAMPEIRHIPVRQRGIGLGLNAGFRAARFENVMFYPIDMSWDIDSILNSVRELDRSDVVIASRRLKESRVDRKTKRVFVSWFHNLLKRLLFGINKDTQATIAFRKSRVKYLEELEAKDSFYQIEFFVYAKRDRLKIREIPTTVRDVRKDSGMNIPRETLAFFLNSMRLKKRIR